VSDRSNIPLQSFSPIQANLDAGIVSLIREKMMED
jgi:hypothetical protein